jgi:hypothetical protein
LLSLRASAVPRLHLNPACFPAFLLSFCPALRCRHLPNRRGRTTAVHQATADPLMLPCSCSMLTLLLPALLLFCSTALHCCPQAWKNHCCASGYSCSRQSDWFWQCSPGNSGNTPNPPNNGGGNGGGNQNPPQQPQPPSGPGAYKPDPPVPAKKIGCKYTVTY